MEESANSTATVFSPLVNVGVTLTILISDGWNILPKAWKHIHQLHILFKRNIEGFLSVREK